MKKGGEVKRKHVHSITDKLKIIEKIESDVTIVKLAADHSIGVTEGFKLADFHVTFSLAGDKGISINVVEDWLEVDKGYPGYENLSEEQIPENVSATEADDEEEKQKPAKLSVMREYIDGIIQFIDLISNPSFVDKMNTSGHLENWLFTGKDKKQPS
ncbi:hypothetical protein L798_05295 [Zootermopsis nevadensis]|uniref:Uncharacterized protein n=1 Tax=Zootermopsis nevadensis TaxID=136037 RepID=A0A067RU13_ZOONE|nr:hypothetical protein L798_05295 [Zootermopsis nevadensis]